MIEAIVFDFDGVVVDTEPLHYRAFLAALDEHSVQFDFDHYQRHYIGFDDRDGFAAISRDHSLLISPEQLRVLIDEKAAAFEAMVTEGLDPLPGVVPLIRTASAILSTAICSGALRCDIDAVLATLDGGGLTDLFETIVTADDVAKSKPDPQSYRLAAERLGIAPSNCVAIEDTPAGLQSARAAGLKTLAVATTYPQSDLVGKADRVEVDLANVTVESIRDWFA
jgi:beta-phosphoglucomutase